MKINVIYEDNHLLVVEKPINIPVQEDDSKDLDFLTLLKQFIKKRDNKPGNVYLGLIHRLDRPVGGIMVFAKTSKCASRLSEQVRNKDFHKKYLCIVDGKMEETTGTFKDYLVKNEKTNMSRIAKKEDKNAKEAILDYEVLKYNEEINMSVVKVDLHTGRHHQIRVQFASRNHSLSGDQKYGTRGRGKQLALWAYYLSILHPITKERMEFTVEPEHIGSWKILDD
jgi:23S rRNA pseudouridine1911/1915/1917 synthase